MAMRGYKFAVEWIAVNDEVTLYKTEEIEEQISVQLVADLFEKQPSEVARAVLKKRRGSLIGGIFKDYN